MFGTKNANFQTGISQVFQLVVLDSRYSGTYDVPMPAGFDAITSIVDINDEYFNVDNVILGDSTTIEYGEYNSSIGTNESAYSIITKVFEEKAGDGQIVFKWFVNGHDVLGDGFQINLNKIDTLYEKSGLKVTSEIKKRESQNKVFTREDTSVDIFAEKSLDDTDMLPVPTQDVYFKEIRTNTSNFYYQYLPNGGGFDLFGARRGQSYQFLYQLSGDRLIGDNTNTISGFRNIFGTIVNYEGVMFSTKIDIDELTLRVSNLEIWGAKDGDTSYHSMTMCAVVKDQNGTVLRVVKLKESSDVLVGSQHRAVIKIPTTETYTSASVGGGSPSPLSLKANQSIEIQFFMDFSPGETADPNAIYYWNMVSTNTSINVSIDILTPLRKVRLVRLKDALNQIIANYSGGYMSVASNILSGNGKYANTGIATGLFMRGLSSLYPYAAKLTTSFKNLFFDGVSNLMALGYDVTESQVIVEEVEYWFKDIQAFDFSQNKFVQETFKSPNSEANTYNNLLFGAKKYSTNKKYDLQNYNTKAEYLSPIVSTKNKFDKQTDVIIDEFRIQEVLTDNSTSTSGTDDDLILIDLVNLSTFTDAGIILGCSHEISGGYLVLRSYQTAFDSLPFNVGDKLRITSGFNAGEYTIVDKTPVSVKLNKTTGIEQGVVNTPVSYTVRNLTKNRSTEGFTFTQNIYAPDTTSNLRHNPKYQMARWAGFFGAGLVKKLGSELMKTTDYKNNGTVIVEADTSQVQEYPGRITLEASESMDSLRTYKQPLFMNRDIEIGIRDVDFDTFWQAYYNWRYGAGTDRNKSRGFFTVNTPLGMLDLYPFGKGGLEHDRSSNILTIRGKIRAMSIRNVIDSITWKSERAVDLHISAPAVLHELTAVVQASKDGGITWIDVYSGYWGNTISIVDDFFLNTKKFHDVQFRVFSVENDQRLYRSQVKASPYPYGTFVVEVISITQDVTGDNCGLATCRYRITGEGTINIKYLYYTTAGTGFLNVVTVPNEDPVAYLSSNSNAVDYATEVTLPLEVSGTMEFVAYVRAANFIGATAYICQDNGQPSRLVNANAGIQFMNGPEVFYGIGFGAYAHKFPQV